MLIQQRTRHDCAICTIAMALGRSYDDVMAAALAAGVFDPEKGGISGLVEFYKTKPGRGRGRLRIGPGS